MFRRGVCNWRVCPRSRCWTPVSTVLMTFTTSPQIPMQTVNDIRRRATAELRRRIFRSGVFRRKHMKDLASTLAREHTSGLSVGNLLALARHDTWLKSGRSDRSPYPGREDRSYRRRTAQLSQVRTPDSRRFVLGGAHLRRAHRKTLMRGAGGILQRKAAEPSSFCGRPSRRL